jgi:CHAD domain-containing protein
VSAFRLKRGEDAGAGVRRVARERADKAVELLRDSDADRVEAVHEARKNVKKLRSTLRLVRPALGDTYKRENGRYRDAARELSDVRDAQVRAATIEALGDRFADDPPAGGWEALRDALGGAEHEPDDLTAARERAAAAIADGGKAIDDWPLSGANFALLRPGLKRAYSRGRKRYRAALAAPGDEALHDWRKRAKDLWYHLRLLREGWPEMLSATADEAHELTDRLGDDHDLVVLGAHLDERPDALPSAQLAHLTKLVAMRRDELQNEAFAYGERLYAEKPKRFVRRIERYWDSRAL